MQITEDHKKYLDLFAKTTLDKNYTNGVLDLSVEIKNLSEKKIRNHGIRCREQGVNRR